MEVKSCYKSYVFPKACLHSAFPSNVAPSVNLPLSGTKAMESSGPKISRQRRESGSNQSTFPTLGIGCFVMPAQQDCIIGYLSISHMFIF